MRFLSNKNCILARMSKNPPNMQAFYLQKMRDIIIMKNITQYPMGRTHIGAALEEFQPAEGAHAGSHGRDPSLD